MAEFWLVISCILTINSSIISLKITLLFCSSSNNYCSLQLLTVWWQWSVVFGGRFLSVCYFHNLLPVMCYISIQLSLLHACLLDGFVDMWQWWQCGFCLQATIPHAYSVIDCDMGQVMHLRKSLKGMTPSWHPMTPSDIPWHHITPTWDPMTPSDTT